MIKLNWRADIPMEGTNSSASKEEGENMISTCNNSGVDSFSVKGEQQSLQHMPFLILVQQLEKYIMRTKDIQAKINSMAKLFKSRSSTLMKPTTSNLAKQNIARDVHSNQTCGRFWEPSFKIDKRNLQNLLVSVSGATKRQKLESGYFPKAAPLKRQTVLLHKAAKKAGSMDGKSGHFRQKDTIPREPDLETAQRAQRSKNSYDSGEQAKPNAYMFKARPLNRRIFEAPSLAHPKKSMPRLPEFQVFQLKTMERAMQHSSANNTYRPNFEGTFKAKCVAEALHKFQNPSFSKKVLSIKGDNGVIQDIKMAPLFRENSCL